MKKLLNWYASCLLILIKPALKRYEAKKREVSPTLPSDEMQQAIVNIMVRDLEKSIGGGNGVRIKA